MPSLIEEEFDSYNREKKWDQVFNKLHNEASMLHNHTVKDARKLENRERNRYRDVHPYDHSRVKLQGCTNDYINANLITVPLAGRRYILTQGPLQNTCGHFWKMVWQEETKGVIMLNKVIEKGDIKCHQYFPEGSEKGDIDDIEYPDVNIRVELLSAKDFSYYVIRTLRLIDMETHETRTVSQFHYVTWPDFGVPQSPDAFLDFLKVVRESGCLDARAGGPPVIHCSAGIGRSGTFCLVDCALLLVGRTRSTACLDLRSMLMDMRQCRAGLVQTADQLRFCYLAVLKGAHRVLAEGDDLGCTASSGDDAALLLPAPPRNQDTVPEAAPPGDEELWRLQQPPPLPQRSSSLPRSPLPQPLPQSLDDRAAARAAAAATRPASSGDSASEPPPPPPRLHRRHEAVEEEQQRLHADSPPVKQPPAEPDDAGYEGDMTTSHIDLRRRRREERLKNTAEQIQKMRQKQQECERLRGQRWTWRFPPWVNVWTISLSVAAAAVVGGYVYYNYL